MKLIIALTFMLALLGLLFSYSLYFYFLVEFKNIIKSENGDSWSAIKKDGVTEIQMAYRVLQLSKSGYFNGSPLSRRALICKKRVINFLYAGLVFFVVTLFAGIFDSLLAGKY